MMTTTDKHIDPAVQAALKNHPPEVRDRVNAVAGGEQERATMRKLVSAGVRSAAATRPTER